MGTFGSEVNRVINELGRADPSMTAIVEAEFQSAILHYESTRFWFNQGSYTFTTSASLANYTWPADFLGPESVMYWDSGTKYPLEERNYYSLNEMDTGQDFSSPVMYALFSQQFRLYPVPQKTYTVVVDYQKKLITLSASTDTNAWVDQASELIRSRVKATLAAGRYKDFDAAQVYHMQEENALDRLLFQTDKYLGGGGKIASSE